MNISSYIKFMSHSCAESKIIIIHSLSYFSVEDLEMNDGSPEKPYFMSKNMMKILGKKNKKFDDPKTSKSNSDL